MPAHATREASAGTRLEAAVVAAVAVALTVAQPFRQLGTASWKTVWAEDGAVFYETTRSARDLLQPYAGYLQLVSRLLGWSAHAVPVERVASFYALAGSAVVSLCAVQVWYALRPLVGSPWLRGILALQVALLPALVLEQTANRVNTLWAVTFAGWCSLLARPATTRATVASAASAFLAATSCALSITFLPVTAALAWRRHVASRVVAGAFAAGCALQALVIVGASDDTPAGARALRDLPGIFSIRVLGSMFLGEQWLDEAWLRLGTTLGKLAVLAFAALLVSFAWRARGEHLVLGVLTIGYATVLYCGSIWIRGTEVMRVGPEYHSIGNRYASLAIWMLTLGLLLLLAGAPPGRWVTIATVPIVAWFAVVSIAGFRGSNPRSPGPEWPASVAAAREECTAGQQRVELDVIPYTFDVTLDCDDLDRTAKVAPTT